MIALPIRSIPSLYVLASVALVAGLAGSARAAEKTAAGVDLSGSWSGYWASDCTRHHGPLFANFCRLSSNQYDVHFRGRFFKILPFRYSVTLDVVKEEGDKVFLSGSSWLGRMFGTFTYEATATSCDFTANYYSCKDDGVFVLHRCCNSCQ
jgi:hypothetical protein